MRRRFLCLLPLAVAFLTLPVRNSAAAIFAGQVTKVQLDSSTLAPDGTVAPNQALNDKYTQAFMGSYLIVPAAGQPTAAWEQLDPPKDPVLIAPALEPFAVGLLATDYLLLGISRDKEKFISFTATLSLDRGGPPSALSYVHIVEVDANGNIDFTDGYLTLQGV